jgi:hypothetical protein
VYSYFLPFWTLAIGLFHRFPAVDERVSAELSALEQVLTLWPEEKTQSKMFQSKMGQVQFYASSTQKGIVSWQDCKRMHPSALVSTMRLSVCSVDRVQEK